jgi:hypothetical protein
MTAFNDRARLSAAGSGVYIARPRGGEYSRRPNETAQAWARRKRRWHRFFKLCWWLLGITIGTLLAVAMSALLEAGS